MAQQPSRTITTQPEYQGPLATSFQASNDDAMSTALSMPPNTGVTPQADSPDPILSQSLPPVSAALQQRILRVATSTLLQMLVIRHQELPLSPLGWMPGISILPQ